MELAECGEGMRHAICGPQEPEKNPQLDALRKQIMEDIEAKLVRTDESLWKRGQVEIRRLQQEGTSLLGCIEGLRDRQDALVAEGQQLKGALLDVTSKFETVVTEMRAVLHALPIQPATSPSPSVASTSASEALGDLRAGTTSADSSAVLDTPAGRTVEKPDPSGLRLQSCPREASAGFPPCRTPESPAPRREHGDFCTPLRAGPAPPLAEDATPAWWGAPPTPAFASPAVLSLASVLPAAVGLGTPRRSPLSLAQCLEQEDPPYMTPPPATPSSPPPASPAPADATPVINVEIVKEKGQRTMGMIVNQADAISLGIESIDEDGAVARHNALQDSSACKLQVGDRIIEVNHIKHLPREMLDECKSAQRLRFVLARAAPPAAGTESLVGLASPSRLRPQAREFHPRSLMLTPTPTLAPLGLGGLEMPSMAAMPPLAAFPPHYLLTPDSALPATPARAPALPATWGPSAGYLGTPGPACLPSEEAEDAEVTRQLFP